MTTPVPRFALRSIGQYRPFVRYRLAIPASASPALTRYQNSPLGSTRSTGSPAP